MADGWVLIDTSAWIHALQPSGLPTIRQQVRDLLTEGRAATCEMVILELAGGTRTEGEFRELREDLEALQQFPVTEAVWESAYRLAHTHSNAKVFPSPPRIISLPPSLFPILAAFFTATNILIFWPGMPASVFGILSR